jgi:hypothetical protein
MTNVPGFTPRWPSPTLRGGRVYKRYSDVVDSIVTVIPTVAEVTQRPPSLAEVGEKTNSELLYFSLEHLADRIAVAAVVHREDAFMRPGTLGFERAIFEIKTRLPERGTRVSVYFVVTYGLGTVRVGGCFVCGDPRPDPGLPCHDDPRTGSGASNGPRRADPIPPVGIAAKVDATPLALVVSELAAGAAAAPSEDRAETGPDRTLNGDFGPLAYDYAPPLVFGHAPGGEQDIQSGSDLFWIVCLTSACQSCPRLKSKSGFRSAKARKLNPTPASLPWFTALAGLSDRSRTWDPLRGSRRPTLPHLAFPMNSTPSSWRG